MAILRYKQEGVLPTPRWAVDRHTKLYYELISQGRGNETDRRFSGDLLGRLHMVKMYRKYGRIDPDIEDEELWQDVQREVSDIED